jgi:diaminohydroxyphosphoribosylaminopyrimidine deaminase/5-amino-6-(5-phosphoribosylamino)uracil reductase
MAFRPLPQAQESAPTPMNAHDPYAPVHNAPPDRPFVIAQLGQSLDGRIATSTGESRWINRDGALDHVHRLRAAVDAVVIGVGTAVADNPRLNVRRVEGRSPARVIIDPWGRLPIESLCLQDDGARRLLIRAVDASVPSGCEAVKVTPLNRMVSPTDIVSSLFERGLRRILIEGGARTISHFIDADALDRLHVLVAPMIIGSGKAGFSLRPIGKLSDAWRPRTYVHVLADGDVLFDCDMRAKI